jgi:putative FmdB family regulatory protein
MPTYEYECQACGEMMDIFQSIKARPLRKAPCASCGSMQPVRRLIGTGGAVLFKGSGFYETDYRSESYKSRAKEDQKSTSSDKPKSDKPEREKSDSSTPSQAPRKDSPAKKDP